MEKPPVNLAPEKWLAETFAAKAASRGGIVRRSVGWVEHEVGRQRMIDEVQRRGFHMIERGGQFIVICNAGGMRVIC